MIWEFGHIDNRETIDAATIGFSGQRVITTSHPGQSHLTSGVSDITVNGNFIIVVKKILFKKRYLSQIRYILSMIACVKVRRGFGGVEVIQFEGTDSPLGNPQVAVDVAWGSICGSDIHFYKDVGDYVRFSVPKVMGHEVSGVVSALPHDYPGDLKEGDRVVLEPHVHCGTCRFCKSGMTNVCENRLIHGFHIDGFFASTVRIEDEYVYKLPTSMDLRLGSLVEPMAVAYNALRRSGLLEHRDQIRGPIVVFGPGKIGYLLTKLLRYFVPDSEVIIIGKDDDEHRLEVFIKERLTTVTFRSNIYDITRSNLILETRKLEKPELVFDCTGSHEALDESISMLGRRGRLVLVGLYEEGGKLSQEALSSIVREEKTIVGTSGALPEDYRAAIKYIDSGLISTSILNEFNAHDCDLAFTKFLKKEVMTALLKFNE